MQTMTDAFLSVPFQRIKKIADGMITVFVGDHRYRIYDFLLNRQSVVFFKIQTQLFYIHLGQGGTVTIPTEWLYNINSLRQQILSDSSFQQRVALQNPLVIGGCVVNLTFLALLQTVSDFFHGILQFAVQVSSPLFFAPLQEPVFLLQSHQSKYQ